MLIRREYETIYDIVYRVVRESLILQLAIFLIMTAIGSLGIRETRKYAPIEREKAETYVGSFEEFRSEDNALGFLRRIV